MKSIIIFILSVATIILALVVFLGDYAKYKDVVESIVLPSTTVLTLLSVAVGIWITVSQYKLKVAEEIRLKESSKAENHIKLLNLFTATFEIAHSRRGTVVSEKLIEKLMDEMKMVDEKGNFKNIELINFIRGLAEIPLHHGLGSQIAAITAIGELGKTYSELRIPALKGLQSLREQFITIPNGQNRHLTPVFKFVDDAIQDVNSGIVTK